MLFFQTLVVLQILQTSKICIYTVQTMKFSIMDFFSKYDQIRRKLRIWSLLLKKSLKENLIFCAVGRRFCKSSWQRLNNKTRLFIENNF